MDLDAPLQESDFQTLRLLGSGGMGDVYEAIQNSLKKLVALKVIRREALESPSRVRRFFAEARALARLRHPQIVGVHGIGRMTDGRYFLVMDLVGGQTTLATLIKRGTVPFDRAAGLVATIGLAIDHAHSRGVVHRDLKPSNVLLDAEGNPHVTDFGLAKVFDFVDPAHPQTTAEQIVGTPHYMAPEQADRRRGPVTPRTDVYGLGGLLHSLLTGEPPVQGDSITQLLARVLSPEPIDSPRKLRPDVPSELEHICQKCLRKDPRDRYATAGEVVQALQDCRPAREPARRAPGCQFDAFRRTCPAPSPDASAGGLGDDCDPGRGIRRRGSARSEKPNVNTDLHGRSSSAESQTLRVDAPKPPQNVRQTETTPTDDPIIEWEAARLPSPGRRRHLG